jgi:mRNA-degrading endonuclease YafQ of YafQ-DinJ toxin-antitoxin module
MPCVWIMVCNLFTFTCVWIIVSYSLLRSYIMNITASIIRNPFLSIKKLPWVTVGLEHLTQIPNHNKSTRRALKQSGTNIHSLHYRNDLFLVYSPISERLNWHLHTGTFTFHSFNNLLFDAWLKLHVLTVLFNDFRKSHNDCVLVYHQTHFAN